MRQSRLKRIVGGPQGEDAFVEILLPTVGEIKALQKLVKEVTEGDQNDVNLDTNNKYLVEHIMNWNWVDDEEVAFPTPRQDVSVLDKLTIEETLFLNQSLSGQVQTEIEDRKK